MVGEKTRLDYLYALTVADIRATNPELWNSWRASLLSQLYSNTLRALKAGSTGSPNSTELIRSKKTLAEQQLISSGFPEKKFSRFGRTIQTNILNGNQSTISTGTHRSNLRRHRASRWYRSKSSRLMIIRKGQLSFSFTLKMRNSCLPRPQRHSKGCT